MTSLPPQNHEEGTMYTEDDMQHVVAREVMKHRMNDYERGLTALTVEVKDNTADIQASLKGINNSLDRQYLHVTECRDEMEDEIEKKFFTKEAARSMEGRLESRVTLIQTQLEAKIQSVSNKITWTVGTLTILGVIINIFVNVSRYG